MRRMTAVISEPTTRMTIQEDGHLNTKLPHHCPMWPRKLLGPTVKRQARCRRAPQVMASRVDAVLKSNEKIFHQFNASRRSQQINRFALVQADSRPFQPLLSFLPGPKNRSRFCQDFSELPRSSTLLGAEWLGAHGGMALVGTMTHSNRLGERVIPAKEHEVLRSV
jgi:hypothetical protein